MPKSVQERREAVKKFSQDLVEYAAAIRVSAELEEAGAFETTELEQLFGMALVTLELLAISAAKECNCTPRGLATWTEREIGEVLDRKRSA